MFFIQFKLPQGDGNPCLTLILKNGLIVDPLNGTNEVGDLAVKEEKSK